MQEMTLEEIQKLIPDTSAIRVIQSLVDRGLVDVQESMQERYKAKKERMVFLNPLFADEHRLKEMIDSLEKAPRQLNVLLTYLHLQQSKGQVLQTELLKQAQSSTAILKSLCEKNILEIRNVETDRIQLKSTAQPVWFSLNPEQERALNEIQEKLSQRPILLHGITGSGKTHVYLHLIRNVIQTGQQVLYLLPEIALTAQLVRRLQDAFGGLVGIYHSRFSQMERVELWEKIRSGHFKIIIGARSAVLLPFQELGLIIVDEEHDASYKQQEPAPRYQARDAALVLAHTLKAGIVLGSATPSLESWYNVQQGKYTLVSLHERFGEGQLPKITLIERHSGTPSQKKNYSLFTPELIQSIQQTLEQRKQIILFQNRRGYAPFLMCSMCGWVPSCKFCDVSLTYHKESDRLHCHYCGSKQQPVLICPDCGNNRILSKSAGTERIEEEVKSIFPHARVQRFDWDILKQKNRYHEIIRQFEQRQIDILVGTQMVVKGLDFEHVRLVGVMNADSLLAMPDFRVNERAFQLLQQVAGRAGRKDEHGKVLIQVQRKNHPVIQALIQQDYQSLLRKEQEERKEFLYPPITRLIRIVFRHIVLERVQEAAAEVATQLLAFDDVLIVGPGEPGISRVRNKYIREVLVKMHRSDEKNKILKSKIRALIQTLSTQRKFAAVQIHFDVDPY